MNVFNHKIDFATVFNSEDFNNGSLKSKNYSVS